jgi:hypothetical protein
MDVAQRLLALSRSGRVEWRITDVEGAFLYSGTSAGVLLRTRPTSGTISLSILNSRGTVVESISTLELQNKPGSARYIQVLETLYEEARRTALKTDKVLEDLLTELDNIPPF